MPGQYSTVGKISCGQVTHGRGPVIGGPWKKNPQSGLVFYVLRNRAQTDDGFLRPQTKDELFFFITGESVSNRSKEREETAVVQVSKPV